MEERKGSNQLIVISKRATIMIVATVLILSLISINIVDKAMDNAYTKGYETGAGEVFTLMKQSAAPVCAVLTVSDETLDRTLSYVDINCLTEA